MNIKRYMAQKVTLVLERAKNKFDEYIYKKDGLTQKKS